MTISDLKKFCASTGIKRWCLTNRASVVTARPPRHLIAVRLKLRDFMRKCEIVNSFISQKRLKSGAEFFEPFHRSKNNSALSQRLACFAYFKNLFCFFFNFWKHALCHKLGSWRRKQKGQKRDLCRSDVLL